MLFSVLNAGPPPAGTPSPGEPLTDGNGHVQISVSINGQASGGNPNQPSGFSGSSAGRPSTLTDIAQALEAASAAGQPRKYCTSLRATWCGVTVLLSFRSMYWAGHHSLTLFKSK